MLVGMSAKLIVHRLRTDAERREWPFANDLTLVIFFNHLDDKGVVRRYLIDLMANDAESVLWHRTPYNFVL